jgi:hypothetical protein
MFVAENTKKSFAATRRTIKEQFSIGGQWNGLEDFCDCTIQ